MPSSMMLPGLYPMPSSILTRDCSPLSTPSSRPCSKRVFL
jgi:hypothetical protein